MSQQWINVRNVVKLLTKWNGTDAELNKIVASIRGRSIVGVVRQTKLVISLFQHAISTDSQPAWELLCMLYRHTAFAQAHTILEADEADDVAQEVMMQLWIKRDKLNDKLNLGGWVRVMAKNRSIDVLRSRKAFAEAEVPTSDEEEGETTEYIWADPDETEVEQHEMQSNVTWDTPEAIAQAAEMTDAIENMYMTLTPLTQRVLDYVQDGLTYQEIAELIGSTEETARQIVSRAERFLVDSAMSYDKEV